MGRPNKKVTKKVKAATTKVRQSAKRVKSEKTTSKSANKAKPRATRKSSKHDAEYKKVVDSKKLEVEEIELAILEDAKEDEKPPKDASKDTLEQILFRLPYVPEPLIGTPKQVQKELDALAKKMQRNPDDDSLFNKIHLYMHGYLINVVLKKFPFIRGLQTVDIYQETLIALRFKAIPNFKSNMGMSFLNFSKMCIRRHLITLLNSSKNIKKHQSINRAISLDSSPMSNGDQDDDGRNTYANIITDGKMSVDKELEHSEAYEVTKNTLLNSLSEFEQVVLSEYLSSSSYREISKNIYKRTEKRHNTKSIDNALLRIRKKANQLMRNGKFDDLPIFLPKDK